MKFINNKKNWKVWKAIRRGISCIAYMNSECVSTVIQMEDRILLGFQELLFITYIRQEWYLNEPKQNYSNIYHLRIL